MTAMGQPRLRIVPCDLARANAFIRRHHRHHGPVVGYRFALAVADDTGAVRGAAIIGRPVARGLGDGWTAEVTRLATDGCPNACSALYGAAWRTARAMGYRRMTTYILDTEAGISLKASGWRMALRTSGGDWSRPNIGRFRDDTRFPIGPKQRWDVGDQPPFPPAPDFGTDGPSPQLRFEFGDGPTGGATALDQTQVTR